ncbi:MAG: Hpt domain-containing protein [Proteobacteria bacterium]|nr:Hpt domain-containing protein [Pseudomonadota bacterium]
MLKDTLVLFGQTLEGDLVSMDVAVAQGDANRLLHAAHHLKSAAGAIGAARLMRAADRVCLIARTRDLAGIEGLVETVRTAGKEVSEALADLS